jgi:metal-dependent amidase/aminoacylase/carboxypeptidase family protein
MWFSNRVTSAKAGKVILLFQPAEEDGSGAQKCFQTQNLLHFPDYVLPYIIYLDQKSDYS